MLFTGKELEEIFTNTLSGIFQHDPPDGAEFPDIGEISTDSRKKMTNALFIALDGEKFDAHDFIPQAIENGAVLICADKAKVKKVPPHIPVVFVDSPLHAYQVLAKNYRLRFKDLKVIALTGSCGKTSTKEALRAIFSEYAGKEKVLATEGNTNNQIGVPQNLFRLTKEHAFAIIEMGTNHFGEILPLAETALPDASMIVSIGSCHLENLKNFEGVATEKGEIFSCLQKDSFCVIPFECPAVDILRSAAEKRTDHIYTFGEDGHGDIFFHYLGGDLSGSSFTLTKGEETEKVFWDLSGRHQAQNAAGAAAMAMAFGIPLSVIAKGLSATSLPGMRMRKSEYKGAVFLNDAYNANPDSMKAALQNLSFFTEKEKTLLILGDMGELGDDSLREHIKILSFAGNNFPASQIFCVGKMMRQAYDVLNLLSGKENVSAFPDVLSAVPAIKEALLPGMTIFLKASRSMQFEKLESMVKEEEEE